MKLEQKYPVFLFLFLLEGNGALFHSFITTSHTKRFNKGHRKKVDFIIISK